MERKKGNMQTEAQKQPLLAGLVIIAGVLLCTLVPKMIGGSMMAVLQGAVIKIEASGNPLLVSAPRLVVFFFPFWAALGMVAGSGLLVLAWPIYRGARWARAAAIGLLAIPSVAGAYMSGPIMFFNKGAMLIFIVVALIGLIPFFALLLSENGGGREKAGRFLLFLLLGVTAAWTFANGHSSLRMVLSRPEPFQLNEGLQAFAIGVPAVWAAVIILLVGIPLMAGGVPGGWWLAMVGSAATVAGSGLLYINHPATTEFLLGIFMAAGCLVLLALPGIGGRYKIASA
jgi:hypothetical protein